MPAKKAPAKKAGKKESSDEYNSESSYEWDDDSEGVEAPAKTVSAKKGKTTVKTTNTKPSSLSSSSAACSAPKFCGECGKATGGKGKFCTSCGEKF